MSAQLEEVILKSYRPNAQYSLPDIGDLEFQTILRGRRSEVLDGLWLMGCGKRLAVDFSIGGKWELVQSHKSGRNHIARQSRAKESTQFRRNRSMTGPSGNVSDETFVARAKFPHDDNRLAHAFLLFERSLNLTKFNAMTSDLHLIVAPSQVFDGSVGPEPGQIACPVHPRARVGVERIRHEAFRR